MARLDGDYRKNWMLIAVFLGLFAISATYSVHFTPPGTIEVRINDDVLYVDKSEVLNKHWVEYLLYLKNSFGENSDIFLQAQLDSAIWSTVYSGGVLNYNSVYADYPVIGVSYQQAVDYCNWRSDRVSEKYNKTISYRLPTKDEWDWICKKYGEENYLKGINKIEKGRGFLNLTDNVSEMVSEEGMAKGINWKMIDTVTTTSPNKLVTFDYDSPTNWIGFRCVAIIK